MPVKTGHLELKWLHMKLNQIDYLLDKIEDVLELDIATPEIPDVNEMEWGPYNYPKHNNRSACSITSLDGSVNGADIFSIREYNAANNVDNTELSFATPTKYSDPFKDFLNTFSVGRSHFLKFGPGGYFPWHRDVDFDTFRIIYTVQNCDRTSLVWILDDKVLPLETNKWYYINTTKKHVVFNPSSNNNSIIAIFNVVNTVENKMNLYYNCLYK